MYGNINGNSSRILKRGDKPQHLMYGNSCNLHKRCFPAIPDKPQHLMYGNHFIWNRSINHYRDKPQHLMYGNVVKYHQTPDKLLR